MTEEHLSSEKDTQSFQRSWQPFLLESVVIVGSILLAFGIDAWWDGRQEREDEQVALIALRADLTATLTALEYWVELHTEAIETTNQFLWMVRSEGPMPEIDQLGDPSAFYRDFALPVSQGRSGETTWPVSIPDHVIGGTVNTLTFDPISANIDLLLSSGDLRLIRNANLRQALASLPAQLADVKEEELIVQDLVLGKLNPLLDQLGNLVRPNLFRRFWHELPPEALVKVSEVEGSPLLANLLASKSHLEGHAVEALLDLGVSLREILELIESEID